MVLDACGPGRDIGHYIGPQLILLSHIQKGILAEHKQNTFSADALHSARVCLMLHQHVVIAKEAAPCRYINILNHDRRRVMQSARELKFALGHNKDRLRWLALPVDRLLVLKFPLGNLHGNRFQLFLSEGSEQRN